MYYETQVVFTEEIDTKNGVKEKKVRRNYLIECDSVSVAEAKVTEFLNASAFFFAVKVAQESKIVDVVEAP